MPLPRTAPAKAPPRADIPAAVSGAVLDWLGQKTNPDWRMSSFSGEQTVIARTEIVVEAAFAAGRNPADLLTMTDARVARTLKGYITAGTIADNSDPTVQDLIDLLSSMIATVPPSGGTPEKGC